MKIVAYLQDALIELKKVSWPTREKALKMTAIVVIASLLVGLYIGGLDLLFTSLLGNILN